MGYEIKGQVAASPAAITYRYSMISSVRLSIMFISKLSSLSDSMLINSFELVKNMFGEIRSISIISHNTMRDKEI